jgi:hypothetical protein
MKTSLFAMIAMISIGASSHAADYCRSVDLKSERANIEAKGLSGSTAAMLIEGSKALKFSQILSCAGIQSSHENSRYVRFALGAKFHPIRLTPEDAAFAIQQTLISERAQVDHAQSLYEYAVKDLQKRKDPNSYEAKLDRETIARYPSDIAKIKNQSDTLIAAFEKQAKGYRIQIREPRATDAATGTVQAAADGQVVQ